MPADDNRGKKSSIIFDFLPFSLFCSIFHNVSTDYQCEKVYNIIERKNIKEKVVIIMPQSIFKATAHLEKGVQVKVKSRDFEITVDEPKSLGGTDTGMNPVEMILGALGACQAITAATFAGKHDMTFHNLWVELEGDLDTDGFMGISDVRKGYSEIRYNIHIDTDEPREKVEKYIEFIEATCPVGDTIANPVTMKLNKVIIENK